MATSLSTHTTIKPMLLDPNINMKKKGNFSLEWQSSSFWIVWLKGAAAKRMIVAVRRSSVSSATRERSKNNLRITS